MKNHGSHESLGAATFYLHASVAQPGTAQDWKRHKLFDRRTKSVEKSCFLRDIPVQIRALALFYILTSFNFLSFPL